MLRITQLEQIETLLRETSHIVDAYKADSVEFPDLVDLWIKRVELVFNNNRLSTSGQLASLRGLLLSAGHGSNSMGVPISGKVTRRKIRRTIAADVLNKAVNIIESTIYTDRARIEEGLAVALKLVSQANHEQLLRTGSDGFEYSKHLYVEMSSCQSLAEGVSVLEGLVGRVDSIISIDRALSYWKHEGA